MNIVRQQKVTLQRFSYYRKYAACLIFEKTNIQLRHPNEEEQSDLQQNPKQDIIGHGLLKSANTLTSKLGHRSTKIHLANSADLYAAYNIDKQPIK